jgi:hypothetical protein
MSGLQSAGIPARLTEIGRTDSLRLFFEFCPALS